MAGLFISISSKKQPLIRQNEWLLFHAKKLSNYFNQHLFKTQR